MSSRHFPVSQEINSDPQVWELTDTFGDRAIRTWLEILAILDREKNKWKLVDGWETVISRKVRQSPATVSRIVGWMLANGWLIAGQLLANGQPEVLSAPKFAKFHKLRSENRLPPNLAEPNLTEPKMKPAPTAGVDNSKIRKQNGKGGDANQRQPAEATVGVTEHEPWRPVADRIFNSDKKKYLRLIVWIKAQYAAGSPGVVITEVLEKFEPHGKDIIDWYPYLTKMATKYRQNYFERQAIVEHELRVQAPIPNEVRQLISGIGKA